MKKLLIYKSDGDFIIERVNEFNHSFKRHFETKEGLLEGLDSYKDVINEYNLDVSESLQVTIINYLYGGVNK